MSEFSPSQARGSRVISRILPPAIRFWLSTQLDHVENLNFQIEGRDRDLLSGHIPEVVLSAQKAIYQGIHLSQADVKASGIRVNLGQVLRRKPLRLLAAFPISGQVFLTTADFNQSLQSPLLGTGLYDLLRLLSQAQSEASHLQAVLQALPNHTVLPHYRPTASIEAEQIILRLMPDQQADLPPIAIATQLMVQDGHQLCLKDPHWLIDTASEESTPLPSLQGFAIDLGSQVQLTTCEIQAEQLSLAGTVQVLPTTDGP